MPTTSTLAPPIESANDRLKQHVRQLEERLNALKAQVRQAQQLAGLGTAAMMIVHEINNLFTPIVGYAQSAAGSDDPEFMKKALRITLANVRTVAAMSDRVLAIGAAKPVEIKDVPVRAIVTEALESLCRDLSRDGIRFVCDVADSLLVRCDPLVLRQVFFNLFLNARDAMSQSHSGTLSVRASRCGNVAMIEVADTGRGIDPEILPYVFDPLQTTKPSMRDGQPRCGGLGLALCRDLVTESGGTIEVASRPGIGTTFTLAFSTADCQ